MSLFVCLYIVDGVPIHEWLVMPLGLFNPPFSKIVYLAYLPNLGGHLSPYWSFGATMNIGSIGAIGATSVNPYIIRSHSKCHQQPPSVGFGR